MKFKIIILTLFLFSCSSNYTKLDKREPYYSKGFAYITKEVKPKKNLSKIANDNSSQRVFNKFLRPNSLLKIINPDTKDYIILKNSMGMMEIAVPTKTVLIVIIIGVTLFFEIVDI